MYRGGKFVDHIYKHRKKLIYFGILPALLLYLAFVIIPILISARYSLVEWNGFSAPKFVGLNNYADLFKNSIFWRSLKNNLIVVFASVLGQVPIGFLLALLVNQKIKGQHFFRTIIFMPVVISAVIISLVWSMVFNYNFGLLNNLLKFVGLGSFIQNWLSNPDIAMFSVAAVIIWQFVGLYFIIFLAALQTVPNDVLEAAEIDGAQGWKRTLYITLPLVKDTILAAIVLCISGSLKTFALIYVMTNGGPSHATEVMAIHMYDNSFNAMKFGYGSAVSIFIVIFGIVLVTIVRQLFARFED
jgi:raffinose/stachyose/melibiose transport system permease protein